MFIRCFRFVSITSDSIKQPGREQIKQKFATFVSKNPLNPNTPAVGETSIMTPKPHHDQHIASDPHVQESHANDKLLALVGKVCDNVGCKPGFPFVHFTFVCLFLNLQPEFCLVVLDRVPKHFVHIKTYFKVNQFYF